MKKYCAFIAAVLFLLTVGTGIMSCENKEDCDCGCGGACGRNCQCVDYADLFALQSEAQQNLNAIFTTEVAYFGEDNTFANLFSDLAWSPEGLTRYAYFLPGDSIQATLTGPYHLPSGLDPAVSQYSFTILAVGNIDCDPTLDVWAINDHKRAMNWINDIYE